MPLTQYPLRLFAVTLLLGLSACTVTPETPTANEPTDVRIEGAVGNDPLIGKFQPELLAQRGQPDMILDVGGKKAWVYNPKSGETNRTGCNDTYLINHKQRIVGYYCR